MPDHWNSEVFCAGLNAEVKSAKESAARAETSAERARKGIHRLRGELEERDNQLADKAAERDRELAGRLEKLNVENAKRAWVFPLITSCVTALVVYLVMHAMKTL